MHQLVKVYTNEKVSNEMERPICAIKYLLNQIIGRFLFTVGMSGVKPMETGAIFLLFMWTMRKLYPSLCKFA